MKTLTPPNSSRNDASGFYESSSSCPIKRTTCLQTSYCEENKSFLTAETHAFKCSRVFYYGNHSLSVCAWTQKRAVYSKISRFFTCLKIIFVCTPVASLNWWETTNDLFLLFRLSLFSADKLQTCASYSALQYFHLKLSASLYNPLDDLALQWSFAET